MKKFLKKRIDTQSRLKLLTASFLMFLAVTSQMYATTSYESTIQQQEIKGTVTDANNSPLPGVNVLVVGTTNGTETDFDGNYSITGNKGDVLQFSFVGMQTQTVIVGDDTTINITLKEDANALDEVVVVGYGTRKKRDITSAVSQITSKQIEASVQASPEFALQGTTSGILVQSASGDPNARPNIRIRGVGTLGFNDPLYVVDGVPISEFGAGATAFASGGAANDIRGSQNILNLINPSDIASITVLKDAAATAVYGMRASNGVILIETKRGKGGRTTFNFSARRGVRNIRNHYDALNTTDYTSLLTEEYTNAGLALPGFIDPSDAAYLGNGQTYDWQSAITNDNALTEDYSFSAQSGGEKANFYFSGALSNQESTLIHNKLKRYTATLTSDFKITKWLKIGETLRVTHSENDDAKGVTGNLNLIPQVLKPAWQPIYDSNDPTGFAPVRDAAGNMLWGDSNGGTGINDLAVSSIGSNQYNIFRNLGSAYAEITPLEGLVFKGTIGADWNNNNRQLIRSKRYFLYHVNSQNQTDFTNRDLTNFSLLTEFLTRYTKEINGHNFQVLFNLSKQKIGTNWVQSSATNPVFEDLDRIGHSFAEKTAVESFKERKVLTGELYKFSYNYNSKYYLDASYRRDGTNVFAPGNRFGNFYGASAAWRISDEDFMKDVSWMDDLKFRVSWGQTGNQETEAFTYLASISLAPALALGNTPDANIRGVFQPGFPNAELSWETSTTTNIGFDGSALNHRLGFSFDYYNRLTDDILQPFPLPVTIGVNRSPVVNLAEVSNKGIELQLDWNDKVGDLEYNIGMNLTTVINKVEKLTDNISEGAILPVGAYYGTQVGESIGFIYGYQMDGIFQTQAEVDDWRATHTDEAGSQADISPGDVRFADLYGNPTEVGEFKSNEPDGLINANDRTVLGKTIPGYYYGFNMGANYKGFDMSMQWQGVGDVQKVNQVRAWGESMTGHANQLASVKNRWTSTNPSNTIPRALRNDPVSNTRFSSRFVEDADYLRLQNLQIGYTFDEKVISKLNLQNLRFYISGNNVALFTKYSGLDPDANILSNTDLNPPATSWLLGVNLTF